MYDVAYWEELSPVTKIRSAAKRKSRVQRRNSKKNNSKKKDVSLKREPTVGDLFGDLLSDLDSKDKDNDTARTRQAGSSRMGQWAVYLLSETEYWTPEALEQLTEKKLQEFRSTAGTVADGETERNYSGQRAAETSRRKSRRW